MPIFDYRAITSNGIKSRGLINAFNERAAKEILAERGLVIKSLKEKTDSLYLKVLTFINPIKAKDLVIFSREFSVMISANLAMVQALKISAEQTDNISLKMLIYEIAYEVDSGSALSSALAKRPKIFTQFFTNVVRSGESSGRLDEVLIYLADEIEKDYNMNGKIIGAMIYPIFVLIGMIGVGIIMMVKVVPSLTGIIDESNAALPWSTRVDFNCNCRFNFNYCFVYCHEDRKSKKSN
jgi:type II secretory pathway component PulF